MQIAYEKFLAAKHIFDDEGSPRKDLKQHVRHPRRTGANSK